MNTKSILLAVACVASPLAMGADKFDASISADESYDSNVDQYDFGDRGKRQSMVSHTALKLSATLPRDNLMLNLMYQPEYSWYHNAVSENNFRHTLTAKAGVKSGAWSIDSMTTLVHIDGSDEGLIYAGQGGAPCFGGVAVRDRRDQWLGRENLSVQYDTDFGFVRGVGGVYWHDFLTEQRPVAGYQNYSDRSEFVGGVDVGFKFNAGAYISDKPTTAFIVGYRYGQQYQDEVLDSPVQFSNCFNRFVVGFEEKTSKRLKFAVLVGPDFRNLGPHAPDSADDQFTRLYVDGSITWTPTDVDELAICAKRYDQPTFGGRAIYTDITYSARYTRKLTKEVSASIEGKLIGCDVEQPSERDDWIASVSLGAGYKMTEQFELFTKYTFEDGESDVPDSPGREFQRHIVTLGGTYKF